MRRRYADPVLIGVLGTLRVESDDGVVREIAERKVRSLLTALVADRGHVVTVDALVERVWGTAPPAHPARTLRAKVSQLRAALDDARPGARDMVVTFGAGYRFEGGDDVVDADRFARLVRRARGTSDPVARAAVLAGALALWRGPAFADAADELWVAPAVTDLADRRVAAIEERAEALLEAGLPQDALDEAGPVLAEHPGRDRLAAVVLQSLYALGRGEEALGRYDALRRRLADELGVDPGPRLRALHERMLRQDGDLAPAARARSNLPAPAAALVGRGAEAAEVTDLLDVARVVTVSGIGGVGKTRLALHVARSRAGRHPGGAWFVDLTALDPAPAPRGGARVAEAVAAAMDLADPPRGRAAQLAAAADGALLVLDNAEHVVDEVAAFVADLVGRAASLVVLVTSREALGLPEERRVTVEGMTPEEGARLFVERARAVRADLVLDPATTAVVELVRRLDGLPLALELAASRLGVLSVEQLLARVGDRLDLLARPAGRVPRRQQTLRGMLDWSWALLDEPQRVLLRRLAVTRGGFTLEAAEACGAELGGGTGVLDALGGLVSASLVVAAGESGRFGLLEAVSTYAAERLDEAGERDTTALRHLDHHLDLARRADAALRGPAQREWVRRLDAERVATEHARREAARRGDADRALALVLGTWWHRWITGRVTTLRDELAGALAVPGGDDRLRARATVLRVALTLDDDPSRAVERADRVIAGAAVLDELDRARVQWMLGSGLVGVRGAGDDSHRAAGGRHLAAALAVFERTGDEWHVATALAQWELWASLYGSPEPPPRSGRSPLETLDALGDGWGVLLALGTEHQVTRLAGDAMTAAALATRALDLARERHLWGEVAHWTATVALVALGGGDDARADALLAESRALAGEVVYDYVAFADYVAAVTARCRGDLAAARAGLDLWFAHGTPSDDVFALLDDGLLALREGDPGRARRAHEAVVAAGQLTAAAAARVDELGAGVAALDGDIAAARRCLAEGERRRATAGATATWVERRDLDVVRGLIDAPDGS